MCCLWLQIPHVVEIIGKVVLTAMACKLTRRRKHDCGDCQVVLTSYCGVWKSVLKLVCICRDSAVARGSAEMLCSRMFKQAWQKMFSSV